MVWDDNCKMILTGRAHTEGRWMYLSQDRVKWQDVVLPEVTSLQRQVCCEVCGLSTPERGAAVPYT